MSSRAAQRQAAFRLWVIVGLLGLAMIAEFQFHAAEWLVGLYLEWGNADRARLERFVQQEIQVAQAREKVKQLVETRTERPADAPRRRPSPVDTRSGVIWLENGKKLVMGRDRFMKIYDQLESLRASLAVIGETRETPELESWSRTILIRPEGGRGGEVYLADDQNYILKRFSITPQQFEMVGVYGASNAGSTFDRTARRTYTSQRFFAMLRGLPAETRDRIIETEKLTEWESSTTRVGISDPEDGTVQVLVEQIVGGQVTIVPLSISEETLREIDVALGEAVPEVETP